MCLKTAVFVLAITIVLVLFASISWARDVEGRTGAPALTDSARTALQKSAFAILKANCAVSGCHSGKHPEQNLLLDPAGVLKSTRDVPSREIRSLMRIDTKRPEKSYLLMKIRGDAGIKGKRMPRGELPLGKDEIPIMELWIQSVSSAGETQKSVDPPKKAVKPGAGGAGGGRP